MESHLDDAPLAEGGEQHHHHHHHHASPAGAARTESPPSAKQAELTEEEVAERHRTWMAEHGRVYSDEAERKRRLGIFGENLRYIEAHNRGGHSYTLGLNQFADLTNEEFRAGYCGGLLLPTMEEPPLDGDDDPTVAEGEEIDGRDNGRPIIGQPPLPPPETRPDLAGP